LFHLFRLEISSGIGDDAYHGLLRMKYWARQLLKPYRIFYHIFSKKQIAKWKKGRIPENTPLWLCIRICDQQK